MLKKSFISFLIIIFSIGSDAQSYFAPSDTLIKSRFHTALGFAALSYTSFSIGLYKTWYSKYSRSSFHLFNDNGEWNQMDKAGHAHSAYFQGVLCYKGAKWTGLNKKSSILTGIICGTLFQSTIEVMDGFSSKWGFSLGDMGANLIGTGLFAAQQYYWDEQRISLKISSLPVSHPDDPIFSTNGKGQSTLLKRANDLYGASWLERSLKDYNGQTYWASFNVHAFLQKGNTWPKWLNVALGYGAENMYGGFSNNWVENGNDFSANNILFPRYRQFYLGFDIDFPKLNVKSPLLKTIFSVINTFKIPSPALEINTEGQIKLHLFR